PRLRSLRGAVLDGLATSRLGCVEVSIDPALDADHPERRLGGRPTKPDVGTQRVERNPALAVPLAPRHLGPAETTCERDPHALGAGSHGAQDGLLHGPPVADPALDLRGDVLGHELSADLRLLDLLTGAAEAVRELL